MIKIEYILVMLLLATALYAYNPDPDIKQVTKIPEILQKNPQFLNDVCSISIYPYKIVIQKSAIGSDFTNEKNYLNRNVLFYFNKNLDRTLIKNIYNEKPTERFDDLNFYTVIFDKTKDREFSIVSILMDKKNNVIWDKTLTRSSIGVTNKVFCVRKLEKNKYMVVYLAGAVIFIDYVYLDKDIPITENYQLPFISVGSSITLIPESISILTDNVIRINYKDGAIEHWKVRLSEEDIKKNMDLAKKAGLSESSVKSARGNSLLWWNGVGEGSFFANSKIYQAWDYDEDRSVEPTYE